MIIRNYKEEDTLELIELFRTTIHIVCKKDYTLEQLDMWAPKNIDLELWKKRLGQSYTLVATEKDKLFGFANLAQGGLIDMFYVSAFSQGKGVGKALMQAIVHKAIEQGELRLHSDVSLTAREFFKSYGFAIEKDYVKELDGVKFNNAIMFKNLIID